MTYFYISKNVFAYRYLAASTRLELEKTANGWLAKTPNHIYTTRKCEVTNDGHVYCEYSYYSETIDESNHLIPTWEMMETDEEREIFIRGVFYLVGSIKSNLKQAKNEKSWLNSLMTLWRIVESNTIPHNALYRFLPEVYSVWKVLYDHNMVGYDHTFYQRLKNLPRTSEGPDEVRRLAELVRDKWVKMLDKEQANVVTHVDKITNLLPDNKPKGSVVYNVQRPTLSEVRNSHEQEV